MLLSHEEIPPENDSQRSGRASWLRTKLEGRIWVIWISNAKTLSKGMQVQRNHTLTSSLTLRSGSFKVWELPVQKMDDLSPVAAFATLKTIMRTKILNVFAKSFHPTPYVSQSILLCKARRQQAIIMFLPFEFPPTRQLNSFSLHCHRHYVHPLMLR